MTTKTVFTGTDEEIIVTLSTVVDGVDVPIPFVDNETSLMTLTFDSHVVDTTGSEVSFDNDGNVIFKLGMLNNAAKGRAHQATLKVIDRDNPNGKDLIHPAKPESQLTLVFK